MNGKCMHDRCGLHVGEHSDDIFVMEKERERGRKREKNREGEEGAEGERERDGEEQRDREVEREKSHIFPTSPIELL
jgi:hypothetical protein